MSKRKHGVIIQHEDGRKAIAYNNDQKTLGKHVVYVIDHAFKLTGQKTLWSIDKTKVIGFID